MPNFFPAFLTEMQASIVTVWPQIDAQMEVVIAKKVNWANLAEGKTLLTDYVVLQIVSVQSTDEYGVANNTFNVHVRLFYIRFDSGANIVGELFANMYAMQDYIQHHQFTTMQMCDTDSIQIDVGEDEAAQSMIEANMPLTAACIAFDIIIGESYA